MSWFFTIQNGVLQIQFFSQVIVKRFFRHLELKVGTHEGTSPCNRSTEELTRRDWSQGLAPWTVHRKHFEEQVTETCLKKTGLNSWDYSRSRLWVDPLSLSLSCETRKKPARKKWPRENLVQPLFSLAGFFCVSLDGLSKRGTTRSLCRRDQSWSLRLDFEAKMASSHDGTSDLLQGLVPL